MNGKTIGHYEILEKLGEGGMGIVYKATDTKLNRTVALKFLPDRVQKDASAKARFLQEAQAAAGLNHPNICTIYGVDEQDGQLYMAMEYIDGGTLSDLRESAIKTPQSAIDIAIQIGQALQKAHENGIVHRDVKADNIMLTTDGQAKVMDFGLAKLKGALKLTRTSSTVGTLGYMAPEQIQGGEVDHRSDIFSFGVLLFEMLTGKLPFRGEHEAAMVYSIVNEEPLDIAALVPDLSPLVVNLIQRCLEKDPEDRYQTMQDVVSELRRSQKKTSRVMRSSSGMPVAPVPSVEEPMSGTPGSASNKKSIGIIAAVVILGALATVAWYVFGSKPIELNPEAAIIPLKLNVSQYSYPGISRDGKWLVFPAADADDTWDIYLMYLDNRDVRKITSEATDNPGPNVLGAAFSPDGGTIAYTRWRKGQDKLELATVNVLGGASRVVATGAVAAKWHPSGERIGFIRAPRRLYMSDSRKIEIWSVAPDGSDERLEFVDTVAAGVANFSFDWSPDGKSIAFQRWFGTYHELVIHNLETGEERMLTNDKALIDEVAWADNGTIFFSSERTGNYNIWMTDENGSSILPVTRGESRDQGVVVSSMGNRLVYRGWSSKYDLWRFRSDGSGLTRLTSHGDVLPGSPFVSDDGERILFSVTAGEHGIVEIDRDGGRMKTLARLEKARSLRGPMISADTRTFMYTSYVGRSDSNDILIAPIDGSAGPRKVTSGFLGTFWYDSNTVGVARSTGMWLVDIRTNDERLFFKDSLGARLVLDGTHVVQFAKWTRGLLPGVSYRLDASGRWIEGSQRKFLDREELMKSQSFVHANDACYLLDSENILWRVDYRTGKRKKIHAFGNTMDPQSFAVRNDGAEIVFVNREQDSRLTLMDAVFKQ